MKNLFSAVLFIYFNFYCHSNLAQGSNKIDSLLNVLKTANKDTARIDLLNDLALHLMRNNPDTAIYFAKEALVSATLINYKMGIADACSRIAEAEVCLGRYRDAFNNANEALLFYDKLLTLNATTDKTRLLKKKSRTYNLIGNIYFEQDNFPEALRMNAASLKIREELGDQNGSAASYINIGSIYSVQGNYAEALRNYFIALKIYEVSGDKSGIAKSLKGIGNVYLEQKNSIEAIKNYFKALKIEEEIYDKSGMANTYHNIGNSYANIRNYAEALENYFTSLGISEEIGDMEGIASTSYVIGNIYTAQKKYDEASSYLDKALLLSIEVGSLEDIKESYIGMAKLDSTQGRFEQSLKNYKMYIAYRDSLYNEENTKKTVQSQMEYEFDRKETLAKAEQDKKDAVSFNELQKQKLLRNGIIIGALFFVLMSLLLFNRFKLAKKLERQQAINSERHRISADLHDDIGSGLSKISLLSELIKRESQELEVLAGNEKISNTLKELSENLSEIIWALNSKNDYLENLIAYMRHYAAEYLENSPVTIKIKSPSEIPHVSVTSEQRRNIFYVVKEALHNIIKHADATEAELNFIIRDNKLIVTIHDNGKGFHSGEHNRFGNGIKNMHSRMQSINGTFAMENINGTIAILEFPV